MNCPVCKGQMVEEDFGEVVVHICKDGCGGIWFNCRDLRMLDQNGTGNGEFLEEALTAQRSDDTKRQRLVCPNCSTPMHRHIYHGSIGVYVDECYSCGGFFLDAGELKAVRDTYEERMRRAGVTPSTVKVVPQPVFIELPRDEHQNEHTPSLASLIVYLAARAAVAAILHQ